MAKLDFNELKKGGVVIEETDFSNINSQFLRDLRIRLNISQRVFADYLGVSKKAIEKWEQGKNKINGPVTRMLFLIDRDPNILNNFRQVIVSDSLKYFQEVKKFEYDEIIQIKEKEQENECYDNSYLWPLNETYEINLNTIHKNNFKGVYRDEYRCI